MNPVHRIVRGTSADILIPLIYGGVETPVDGWGFRLTVKPERDDDATDAAALLRLSTQAGTIVPHDATRVRALIVPADTAGRAVGRYVYDVEGISPSGRIEALERGWLYLDREVTAML